MMKSKRIISLIISVIMILSCIPSMYVFADTSAVIYSEGFNSYPTNSSAPANISVDGGSGIYIKEADESNKSLYVGLDDANASLSFPLAASSGTVWIGTRFKLHNNINNGAIFQIIGASGSKVNLINIAKSGASLYDGKVFKQFRKQMWTDMHVKIDYDRKNFSVYVDGRCVVSNWKYIGTMPAMARVGFEFSNTGSKSAIEFDRFVAYKGNRILKEYPSENYNTESVEVSSETKTTAEKLYLFEDFSSFGINATYTNSLPYTHIIETRNLQGHTEYHEGDRMYLHMERLEGRPNTPRYDLAFKYFDASNYVVDMMVNVFSLNDSGISVALRNTYAGSAINLFTAEQNGIIKLGGDVFNNLDFNRWTRLSFVVDAVSSSFDVYVDGVMVREGVAVSADLKKIDRVSFQLFYGRGSGAVGLDAIAVYEGKKLKPGFETEHYWEQFTNSYLNEDKQVEQFIGDKGVFCVTNSAFYKNGKKTKFEATGYETFEGTPMGAVEAMCNAYGVGVTYDANSKTLTLSNGAVLTVGSDNYTIGGKAVSAGGFVEEKDGTIFAPAKTFFEKVLGKTATYEPNWQLVFVADDGSMVNTSDSTLMRLIMYKMIFDRMPADEMEATVKERFPNNEHPRALITKADIERVKKNIETDSGARKLYNYLKLNCDSILETEPVGYATVTTSGEILNARTREMRLADLGIMYQISGDTRYADRAVKELEEMVKMPYFGYGKALNSGALMAAFARGYDLFYDYLTPELKSKIEDSVLKMWERDIMDGSGTAGTRADGYMHTTGNFVPVHNGPYLESTMVFVDEPKMAEHAKKQFDISERSFEGSMADLAPDGACPEGAGYWMYTVLEWAPAVKTLLNTLGTDLGFPDHLGMKKSCYFMMDLHGVVRLNPFNDSGTGNSHSSRRSITEQCQAMFLLSDIYQDSAILTSWMSKQDNFQLNDCGTSLVWYKPELMNIASASSLDNRYRGELDFVALRSSYVDENALFISAHSGQNYMSHAHIDGGTYTIDAMGLNWVTDLGTESYASNYDPRAGRYYRTRPEAHNLYLINPRVGYQGQDVNASGATVTFESSERDAYAIVDMSKYYVEDVISAQRGYKLADDRSHIVVRDEMSLKNASDIISFIHTQADIEIIDDHRAIFHQFGKKMLIEVTTSGKDLSLEAMECVMLPTSPKEQPDAQDNSEYRKLAIKLSGFGNVYINVKFTPLYDESITSTKADDVMLALWANEEGSIDTPRLTSFSVNSTLLDGFNPLNTQINLTLPAGTTAVPAIDAKAGENATVQVVKAATSLFDDMIIKVCDNNNADNVCYYTVKFVLTPEVVDITSQKLAPISSIISEDTGENITTALTDRNLETGRKESAWGREYMIDLGAVYELDSLITAFQHLEGYKFTYDIEVSEDGVNFKTKTGQWSLGSDGYEALKFGDNVKARYIRYIANGRTSSSASLIYELAVSVK